MTDLGSFVGSLPRRCRAAGMDVPADASVTFARAVAELGPTGLGDLYWAGRCTLVRRPEDIAAYDRAVAAALAGTEESVPPPVHPGAVLDLMEGDGEAGDGGELRWSAVEVLRHTDLAELGEDDLDRALEQLRVRRSRRRSRRRRPRRGATGPLDLRRTARASLRTHGETVDLFGTERPTRPRRLVVLLDVSGSMEPYARALLRFAHRLRRGQTGVEVFALGTRLTRLTAALSTHDPRTALGAAGDEIADWAGGTRLGASLRRFNDEWGTAGTARGATVVILSDGWDRGDPGVLDEEMARLHRVAHRIVWVNPLKATDGYAPLARGMAAALPHVDEFLSAHNVDALGDLVEAMAR